MGGKLRRAPGVAIPAAPAPGTDRYWLDGIAAAPAKPQVGRTSAAAREEAHPRPRPGPKPRQYRSERPIPQKKAASSFGGIGWQNTSSTRSQALPMSQMRLNLPRSGGTAAWAPLKQPRPAATDTSDGCWVPAFDGCGPCARGRRYAEVAAGALVACGFSWARQRGPGGGIVGSR